MGHVYSPDDVALSHVREREQLALRLLGFGFRLQYSYNVLKIPPNQGSVFSNNILSAPRNSMRSKFPGPGTTL